MKPPASQILNYAPSSAPKPRPRRLLLLCLLVAFVVWNWPRLTPTFFPNRVDLTTLILLAPATFLIASTNSLPPWNFTAFGGFGVSLFLMANFNDNNFRRTAVLPDLLVPWAA